MPEGSNARYLDLGKIVFRSMSVCTGCLINVWVSGRDPGRALRKSIEMSGCRVGVGMPVGMPSCRVDCQSTVDRERMRLGIRYAVRLAVRRYGESASVDELGDATKELVVLELWEVAHGQTS